MCFMSNNYYDIIHYITVELRECVVYGMYQLKLSLHLEIIAVQYTMRSQVLYTVPC